MAHPEKDRHFATKGGNLTVGCLLRTDPAGRYKW